VCLCCLLALVGRVSHAADDGLYDPAPPADAAFVRAVHAGAGQGAIAPALGPQKPGELSYAQASPYVVVPQGQAELTLGASWRAELEVVAGRFYTAVRTAEGVQVLSDPVHTNLAKTLLVIYNLCGAEGVSLRTADGATTVIDGVAADSSGHRAVNPMTISLGVWVDGTAAGALEDRVLERGAAYSVFVLGSPEEPQLVWVPSSTATR